MCSTHFLSYFLLFSIMYMFFHSFSYLMCMTGPQPLSKPVLHRLQYSHSSFNFQYPPVSLRSSSSCLHLLFCLSVIYILPSIFFSMTCFLEGSSQLDSFFGMILLCSSTLCNTSPFLTRSVQLIFSIFLRPKFPGFSDLLTEFCKFQHRTKL